MLCMLVSKWNSCPEVFLCLLYRWIGGSCRIHLRELFCDMVPLNNTAMSSFFMLFPPLTITLTLLNLYSWNFSWNSLWNVWNNHTTLCNNLHLCLLLFWDENFSYMSDSGVLQWFSSFYQLKRRLAIPWRPKRYLLIYHINYCQCQITNRNKSYHFRSYTLVDFNL